MVAKIDAALAAIDRVFSGYRHPCFMCSFGKDSMVLLDLLERHYRRVPPIVFHRDPWWPEKYAFADRMILEKRLEVYDYAPLAVKLWHGAEIMAFTNFYQIGPLPHGVLRLPKNIKREENQRFVCGLDVLKRPSGGFNYPWDVTLIGHKNSDSDQIAGKVTLSCDIRPTMGQGPDLAFPLRMWTDDDIWDYTERYNVPQQPDRYDVAGRKEFPDKRANSDYANVCIACCDSSSKERSTWCPKHKCEVACAPHLAPYDVPPRDYYGDATAS